jgi:hypothetical protein
LYGLKGTRISSFQACSRTRSTRNRRNSTLECRFSRFWNNGIRIYQKDFYEESREKRKDGYAYTHAYNIEGFLVLLVPSFHDGMGCFLIFGNFSKSTCIRMAGDGRDSLIQDFVLRGFLGKKEPIGGFRNRVSRPAPL